MCGIIGIVGITPVNQQLYDGLLVLQHRGQDSAGIATCNANKLILRKNNGFVREVFQDKHMANLRGNIGIGHVRYPTAGTPSPLEAQPFYVNSPFGIVLSHNGNLFNAEELKKELFFEDQRHINTDSDSEVLLNVFAHELMKCNKVEITEKDIFDAVCRVYSRCKGAYAAIAMIVDHGIVAFRDPHGIRPLIFGKRTNNGKDEYCVASESCALKTLEYEIVRDVAPGEVIFIEKNGTFHSFQCVENPKHTPCIFEYVYLARPDSVMDNIYVHKARIRLGKKLAKKIKKEWPDYKEIIDVIIPIPSTSRIIALEMARKLRIPYHEGFTKNRYIGRTFIMPGQEIRTKNIRKKLNTLDIEFKDKNVLLVDDSIVRGTTSKDIIRMAREAGAKNVYMASASPPLIYPNIYGIDMPVSEELIAYGKSIEEIAEKINADRLIYQDLEDLIYSVKKGNPNIEDFDCSIFNGNYIVSPPKGYFDLLAKKRCDKMKTKNIEYIDEEDNEYGTQL